jgi:nucleotide-binding universal stress UspA family protein
VFQKLLIPLDGSQLAEAVLPYAIELASRCGSKVLLIQVVPLVGQVAAMGLAGAADMTPVTPPDMEALNEALAAEVRRAELYLQEVAKRLSERNLEVEWEIRRGTPAQEIVQCAKDREASLIAISTHGRSGLGRLIFGSVADQVLRQSGLPILLVKPDMRGERERAQSQEVGVEEGGE